MPDDLGDINNNRGGWDKVQVIHACCQCRCVNPRHLLWGNNKLNASNNAMNSYQAILDARGDDCIALQSFVQHWKFKMHAPNVVGEDVLADVEHGA